MSKKFDKLGPGPQLGYLVVFGASDWDNVEKAYGHKLPDTVRRLISVATLAFTLSLPIERNALKLTDAVAEIQELIERAEALRAKLFSPHYWKPEYQEEQSPWLDHKLIQQLESLDDTDPNEKSIFRISLTGVIESGHMVLKRTRERTDTRDGDSWAAWVHALTVIMKAFQLPTGVRRDVYRVGRNKPPTDPSDFVTLIKALQAVACPDYHKSYTDGGLAKAIGRDRSQVSGEYPGPEEAERELLAVFGLETWPEHYRDDASPLEDAVRIVIGGATPGIIPFIPEPFYRPPD